MIRATNIDRCGTQRAWGWIRFCLAIALASGVLASNVCCAGQGIINYQAKLTSSGGSPITTPVNVTFTFWDAATSGTQLGGGFADTDLVTPDAHGICSADIGDDPGNPIPSTVFASDTVYLNVHIGGSDVLPRARIAASGFAINAFPLIGQSFVTVQVTANAVTNGTNLIAAYNNAKALTPYGNPLSATNRATVIIPPANYDMGTGELTLDHEFVDLAGLSLARDQQYIVGASNGLNTGVLRQTANDVRIENLVLECTAGIVTGDSRDAAAYFPDSATTATVMRNCAFRSGTGWGMRVATAYPGTYRDSDGGYVGFGGQLGNASGTFTNCVGGGFSFGGSGGSATGTFINCTGQDNSFGQNGPATGTFINCTAGGTSFGGSGLASGSFLNCVAGESSFGGRCCAAETTASGTFRYCTGGELSFGGGSFASGLFEYCTGVALSFGGGGDAAGTFINCVGGDHSFGGNPGFGTPAADNGKFYYCTGATGSFTTNGSPAPAFGYCLSNGVPFP